MQLDSHAVVLGLAKAGCDSGPARPELDILKRKGHVQLGLWLAEGLIPGSPCFRTTSNTSSRPSWVLPMSGSAVSLGGFCDLVPG